ncbi:inosine-uridine preferring nucleoside hydrolase, putative [Trichomonas vaginalis G3]|uniref:Inosine-uridine preferring nucleoside hydrolase, putative n=1 Tax=Trichomonas vaginalis (strain ATCC PRA-98 / G3) TaxID=412133 RepID=A2D870_TRIV3|nr:inosine-uridine preferring nucleoside hydrolase family [Trichomonas vaginalis G3]EAY23503.1 inosine-uridine preferring nucleoside hydrolase, putative [Trichomonas vaginalis G3]KAI5493925.1 inosine-uridine preferring nucleoside hydrolase family [Trichomonas vaginalis G3]|eukprot:XP_001584489.1 inosine-uridine preferring nucleoside hydrolase [Trichomonas vaginalis G3]
MLPGYRLPSIYSYKYENVDVPYRSERLKISDSEMKQIKKIKASQTNLESYPQPELPVKCIIDTDIGTDIDDAMAILYGLHLENLEILGITTNYGPADLRAAIVRKIQDAYLKCHPEKKVFPIVAGASCPLGSHRDLFLAQNEGLPFMKGMIAECISLDHMKSRVQSDAADFMIQTCNQYPN